MTNQEIKAQLIQQFNDATVNLHQIQGAIQLLQQLEERDAASEETEEPSGASAAPIPTIED